MLLGFVFSATLIPVMLNTSGTCYVLLIHLAPDGSLQPGKSTNPCLVKLRLISENVEAWRTLGAPVCCGSNHERLAGRDDTVNLVQGPR
jgi:hypothetical protein